MNKISEKEKELKLRSKYNVFCLLFCHHDMVITGNMTYADPKKFLGCHRKKIREFLKIK